MNALHIALPNIAQTSSTLNLKHLGTTGNLGYDSMP